MSRCDNIDAILFEDAANVARSRVGMGSLSVIWNPYEVQWMVRIDYADGTKIECQRHDINDSLRAVLDLWSLAFPG